MRHSLMLATASAATIAGSAMAGLVAGDIAIIGINTSTTDSFAILFLSDIAQGETISFTDNGWKASGVFRTGEGVLSFTSQTAIARGSVRLWTSGMTVTGTGWSSANPSNFALNATGDSLIAYQGSFNGTTGALTGSLLYATQTYGAWNADATNASTSAAPTSANLGSLVTGTTALAISTANGYYSGTTTGTRTQLLAAIADATNWTTSTAMTSTSAWATAFTVPAPGAAALVGVAGIITARRRKA